MANHNIQSKQKIDLQNIENKMGYLLCDKPSINEFDIEWIFNILNQLANYQNLPDDVNLLNLSNCYVEFLKCISIYLINIQFNIQDFDKLRQWFQVIYDKPTGDQLAQIFTQDIAIPISDEVCKNYVKLGFKLSTRLLRFINSVAERDMLNRALILNKFQHLTNLYNVVCICGDFVLQINFFKFMIHVCTYDDKYQFASKLFHGNWYCEAAFMNSYVHNFEDSARIFLNIVNNFSNQICTVRGKYIKIDDIEFKAVHDDFDYYSVWLDVNMISQTISISCNITSFPEKLISESNGKVGNEFIIINFSQISHISHYRQNHFGVVCVCFNIDLLIPTEDYKFLNQNICLKIFHMSKINKLEQKLFPVLQQALTRFYNTPLNLPI